MSLRLRQKRQVSLWTPVCVMTFRTTFVTSHILQFLRHHHPVIGEHGQRMFLTVTATMQIPPALLVLSPLFILRIDLSAMDGLVPVLPAKMTNYYRRFLLVLQILVRRSRELKPRMHVLAFGSVGAKPGHVVRAQHPPDVPVSAVRPMPAEAPVVPRAVFYLALRIYVQEGALFVVAGVETGVEVALGHLGHIVLVQELALVTLFAEAAQPMLADYGAVTAHVTEGAQGAFLATHGRAEELANRCDGF